MAIELPAEEEKGQNSEAEPLLVGRSEKTGEKLHSCKNHFPL